MATYEGIFLISPHKISAPYGKYKMYASKH